MERGLQITVQARTFALAQGAQFAAHDASIPFFLVFSKTTCIDPQTTRERALIVDLEDHLRLNIALESLW
jgi:hypothetical protein